MLHCAWLFVNRTAMLSHMMCMLGLRVTDMQAWQICTSDGHADCLSQHLHRCSQGHLRTPLAPPCSSWHA